MQDESLMNGLLTRREELQRMLCELREQLAVISNDIEAVERILLSLGYSGELVGETPRINRVVLFYRNELREFLLAELHKAGRPMTARQLACKICDVEGRDWRDRKMLTDLVRRVGCTMRKMRASRMVERHREDSGVFWRPSETTNFIMSAESEDEN